MKAENAKLDQARMSAAADRMASARTVATNKAIGGAIGSGVQSGMEFFSWRSYADAAGAAAKGNRDAAISNLLDGAVSEAPGQAGNAVQKKLVARGTLRSGAKTFTRGIMSPLGIIATPLDYLSTTDDVDPRRFENQWDARLTELSQAGSPDQPLMGP